MSTTAAQTARPATRRDYRIEDEDFAAILDGKLTLPNFEEIDVAKGAGAVAGYYGKYVRGRAKVSAAYPSQASFFLTMSQGGGLTGEGYALWSEYENGKGYVGRIGKFAICKHEHVEGPGANHSRGWHPGYCGVCGLDMSVDSGD